MQLTGPYATDLHVLASWLRNRKLEVKIFEHPAMKEYRTLHLKKVFGPGNLLKDIISPWQLHVRRALGMISVIRGGASFGDFEIYCLEGNLFDSTYRYPNVKSAGEAIVAVLSGAEVPE